MPNGTRKILVPPRRSRGRREGTLAATGPGPSPCSSLPSPPPEGVAGQSPGAGGGGDSSPPRAEDLARADGASEGGALDEVRGGAASSAAAWRLCGVAASPCWRRRLHSGGH
jgi:hypothetical protein